MGFNEIYEAAQDKNKEMLDQALQHVSIDVRTGQWYSPACKLAAEGDFEAATWLQQRGANVNDIACGAARGGHEAYAERLRRDHSADVNWIALGAAWGGHEAYAER